MFVCWNFCPYWALFLCYHNRSFSTISSSTRYSSILVSEGICTPTIKFNTGKFLVVLICIPIMRFDWVPSISSTQNCNDHESYTTSTKKLMYTLKVFLLGVINFYKTNVVFMYRVKVCSRVTFELVLRNYYDVTLYTICEWWKTQCRWHYSSNIPGH